MLKKNFYSMCLTLIFTMCCLVCIPNKITVHAEDSGPTLIYRTSVSQKAVGNTNWQFIHTLKAYDNGWININVQCAKSDSNRCGVIGNVAYDDSKVTSIGQSVGSNLSKFYPEYTDSKYITSFEESNTVYTFIFNDWGRRDGCTLMYCNLYVKEPYLHSNISMTFFGEDIEIPFGNEIPNITSDTTSEEINDYIAQLESEKKSLQQEYELLLQENTNLKNENTESNTQYNNLLVSYNQLYSNYSTLTRDYEDAKNQIKELKQLVATLQAVDSNTTVNNDNISRLDTNKDGKINSIDATNILEIYAINSTGGNIKTFEDLENYKNNQKEKDNKPTIINSLFPEEDGGDLNNGTYNNIKHN